MKEVIILFLSLIGICLSTNLCCDNKEIIQPRGYCGNATQRIHLKCLHGYMIIKDVILDGYKVYTQDLPNFVITEDPNMYCLGEIYRNASDPSLGTAPSAVVCFEQNKWGGGNIET